jgi:hypothetical protein
MTDDDYDALSQKQLASIKRDMRISLEDAAVRATYKVMAELAQPEQEPVAFYVYKPTLPRGNLGNVLDSNLPWVYDQDPSSGYSARMLVYTTPPQRTWVGLTDEEIADCAEKMEASDPTDSFWREFFRGIEAKLKEKNT